MNQYNIIDIDGDEYAEKNIKYWDRIEQDKYNLLLRKAEIPPYYYNIEFKHYKGENSRDNLNKVIKYSQECFTDKFDHIHLYLWGSNSSQKTAIAVNIAKNAIRQSKRVRFILASTLIDRLMKNQGFSYSPEIEDYIKELKVMDMLIIDDAFDENKNLLWTKSSSKNLIVLEWDKFLRELVVSDTKIVVTSNIAVEFIRNIYSESLYELVDRNFIILQFKDSYKAYRKRKLNKVLE